MKAPDAITTPADYLAWVPEKRREAMTTMHQLIRRTAPDLEPVIVYGMIGYGLEPYRTQSGCSGEWPRIALASQKAHMSLYLCGEGENGCYPAEEAKERLGKVSVGKSCIRFTKLENLNLEVVEELVAKAAAPRS
ncbi:iron chaperone [Haloferula rosea]|uniref:DUF1801 domain-containing protein n=1 Tax=Haloferula rosea TaxID=490093 RepID=A0A934R7I5_9BACT|nr:DUF1801 domain-containing protein [Haloferula rosea]MBK1826709.1 DUF1801 domain-containing protein [Haloferula rosea]